MGVLFREMGVACLRKSAMMAGGEQCWSEGRNGWEGGSRGGEGDEAG